MIFFVYFILRTFALWLLGCPKAYQMFNFKVAEQYMQLVQHSSCYFGFKKDKIWRKKNKYVLYITERNNPKNRPLSGQNLTVLNVCSATSETLFCIYIKKKPIFIWWGHPGSNSRKSHKKIVFKLQAFMLMWKNTLINCPSG